MPCEVHITPRRHVQGMTARAACMAKNKNDIQSYGEAFVTCWSVVVRLVTAAVTDLSSLVVCCNRQISSSPIYSIGV